MECSKVDFPDPFSPWSTTRGCERSTIIGMWKFRLVKTGCPRILRCIASHQDSRAGWGPAQTRRRGLTGLELLYCSGSSTWSGPRRTQEDGATGLRLTEPPQQDTG